MTKNEPTSDSGIAINGMATARRLPRNRKMTTLTISSDSISVLTTSWIELVMNLVPS